MLRQLEKKEEAWKNWISEYWKNRIEGSLCHSIQLSPEKWPNGVFI